MGVKKMFLYPPSVNVESSNEFDYSRQDLGVPTTQPAFIE